MRPAHAAAGTARIPDASPRRMKGMTTFYFAAASRIVDNTVDP
jgi:hypothetical protein